uniref:C-type lectin domain-containing protein n=1 Tax=Electrophorus electricus TaxID=8005 RepID=A0A4W4H2I1_ELEEL
MIGLTGRPLGEQEVSGISGDVSGDISGILSGYASGFSHPSGDITSPESGAIILLTEDEVTAVTLRSSEDAEQGRGLVEISGEGSSAELHKEEPSTQLPSELSYKKNINSRNTEDILKDLEEQTAALEEVNLTDQSTLNTTTAQGCAEGWVEFMGSCYIHFKLNAHLVSVTSQQEQDFVNTQAQDYQWIGLSDRDKKNEFRWTDGTLLVKFMSIIHQLQLLNDFIVTPDNYYNTGEDCVVMIWHELGQWNDVPCNYHLPFTCKSGPGKWLRREDFICPSLLRGFISIMFLSAINCIIVS